MHGIAEHSGRYDRFARALNDAGLMAVALVIFSRWDPVRCLWASLLFGGAGALVLAGFLLAVMPENGFKRAAPGERVAGQRAQRDGDQSEKQQPTA